MAYFRPKRLLDRRTVLKGLLGGAAVGVSLPLLDVFLNDNGTALADGTALPRRFGTWIWGNGVIPERWFPTETGRGFAMSPELTPFATAGLAQDITIVSGMKVFGENLEAHFAGPAGLLAGHPLAVNGQQTFSSPSVDVVVREAVGGATRFRSIEAGVQRGVRSFSVNGPNNDNPVESNPIALYRRIFGEGFTLPGEEPIIDPRWALRRSVLSAVQDDITRLESRLGSHDRARVDQHLTNVRELELQLLRLEEDPPDLAACMMAQTPLMEYPDVNGREQMFAKHRAVADILTYALACDQTRVFSVMFSGPVSNIWYPNTTMEHHNLTHNEPGDQPQVDGILTSIMDQLAYFVGKLASVQEGDGRLLDNMVCLGTTDCSRGRDHSIENYPLLLAGSACNKIKMGLHHRGNGENASQVILSLIRAMGINAGDWGVGAARTTTGLSAIEV
ncbi:MAG: DUF1552 domain-containing protein [Myxococcales bacterium]|nr:DUF1552 domain-containing protein [Myxococcales bacterium]MCB9629959.1 DUF1552 domain-containing protein [Sandaracinaceae bacterium]